MKYSTILLALAATVYAQSLEQLVADIPACAVDCMANAATKNGCGVADYDCQCGEKYEQLFTVAQPCVREACETGELTGVISGVDAVCKHVEANPGSGGDQSAAPSDETSADAAQTTATEASADATTTETSAAATTTKADDSTSTAAETSADAPVETGAAANVKVAGGLLGAALAIAAIM